MPPGAIAGNTRAMTALMSASSGLLQLFNIKRTFFVLMLLLVCLYTPVIADLMTHEWAKPESGHAPIVLALSFWLMYRNWQESLVPTDVTATRLAFSLVMQFMAAILYIVGNVGDISQLAYGSIIPLLLGSIVPLQRGVPIGKLIFPLFFLLFSVPLPGFIVDPLTQPMKQLVAALTVNILHAAGFPIARSGVMLYLGQYELQVADACAGLRTLFTLEALGLLYVNLFESSSRLRNILIVVMVVPISLLANVTRVIALCLITYYFGDAAAQGFLHQFAGVLLFVCALTLLIGADLSLRFVAARRTVHSK